MIILVKAVAGSHLFGTNTENSDHDYKGVFLPTPEDVLLGNTNQTINQKTNKSNGKNTKEDIDIELYSLDKFLKMLYQGQTVAWELLFTPDTMILEKHPIWDEIRQSTPQFLNKKVDAFIGYCKQQAHRYGVRGSRLDAIEKSLKVFDKYKWHNKIGDISKEDLDYLVSLEHIEWIEKTHLCHTKKLLSICGKKFEDTTMLKYARDPIVRYYEEYGARSRLAKQNQGIDWKALSHAVRVCMQASSLLTKGYIELPMSDDNINILKSIKAGEVDFDTVSEILESHLQTLIHDKMKSKLPEEPNIKVFENIQINIYKRLVRGEL